MILPSVRKYLSIPLAAFLLTSILRAQTPGTGAIVGTVRDPSGLVVVGAAVSAVNESTSLARTATTNSTGVFTMPLLSLGNYSITVSLSVFAHYSTGNSVRVLARTARRVAVVCANNEGT